MTEIPMLANKNEAFWKEQLGKLKESGLSRARYCRENGINYDNFGYWIAKLCPVPSAFLPVNVQASESNTSHSVLCTLELRSHIIKIHDLSALSHILDRII